MSNSAGTLWIAADPARARLAERLHLRKVEIEQAILTRVYAIADPGKAAPEYAQGLRAAVSVALEYGIAAIAQGNERPPTIPTVLLVQVRLAVRNGVSLDTVLRRYLAGYTQLGDFLAQEAAGATRGDSDLRRLLRSQSIFFDRLVAVIGEEYVREAEVHAVSSRERQIQRIDRLLAGELIDTSDIKYDFDGWHVGAIVAGSGAEKRLAELGEAANRVVLTVQRENGTTWAWLGGRAQLDFDTIESHIAENWADGPSLCLGEPAQRLTGWRLTHRQARAAMPVAMLTRTHLTRYSEVALVSSILQDDLLAASLRQLYLAPLDDGHNDGTARRETLRAYFAAGRNTSSAASTLGVTRHTVKNRLRIIEQALGKPLEECATEMEVALKMDETGSPVEGRET